MPWTADDADKHKKGMTANQKKQWAAVANAALAKCEKEGGDKCDVKAIMQANGAVNKAVKMESFVNTLFVIEEAGRMISSANKKKLTDAVAAMTAAMEHLNNLMSDQTDTQESVNPLTQLATSKQWVVSGETLFDEAGKILAQDDSYDSKRGLVSAALRKRAMLEMMTQKAAAGETGDWYDMGYGCMPYIRDMYDDTVVYSQSNELYQCEYSVIGNECTLGDAIPVKVSYVPDNSTTNSESVDINVEGDLIELKERAVAADGTATIKLISPGWGSSGYYSEKMLKRDGPKVFKRGQHMYINHQTAEQDLIRPERDLHDLAGVLGEDATWQANGQTGPGLYAKAKVFDQYSKFIDEAAPYIGTSIRASGSAYNGEAEGRQGKIIDSLVEGYSVDYVTLPGRGGEVLPLLEAARRNGGPLRTIEEQLQEFVTVDITPEELATLREAASKQAATQKQLDETRTTLEATNTTLARMSEAMILSEARTIVTTTLAAIELPDVTRARLVEMCSKNPSIKEGVLDKEALIEATKKTAEDEIAYLASASNVRAGQPRNVGTSVAAELTEADIDAQLNASFRELGFSESAAKTAVTGRR